MVEQPERVGVPKGDAKFAAVGTPVHGAFGSELTVTVTLFVTLGSVIRGGTPHFDYVCRGVTDGVREVMRTTNVPVAFGVLTTDDIEQALSRAGGSEGNKGAEVALAAVEMARLFESESFASRPRSGARVGRARNAARSSAGRKRATS